MDTAGNAPGPAIAAGANALVEVVAQSIDNHSAGLADRTEHSGLVDEQAGSRRGNESSGRVTLGLTALGRSPLGSPLLEAALPSTAASNPDDRSIHQKRVDIHMVPLLYSAAQVLRTRHAAERRLELWDGEHHEAQLGGLVGKLALNV